MKKKSLERFQIQAKTCENNKQGNYINLKHGKAACVMCLHMLFYRLKKKKRIFEKILCSMWFIVSQLALHTFEFFQFFMLQLSVSYIFTKQFK